MLQAKTKEQQNHIEEIANKHLHQTHCEYCDYTYSSVYRNDSDVMEINIKCQDCKNELSIDIPFDMMAEIVDYLRSVNRPKGLDLVIVDEPMQEVVDTWLQYKKEKGQSYKPTGFKTFYKKLCELSGNNPQVAMAIIEQSMQNNYAGIFPLRNNNNNINNYGRETITDKIRRTVEEANVFSQQISDRIGKQADVCDGDDSEVW